MNITYNIEISKSGEPTISVPGAAGKKVFLHSQYSPLKEAGGLADKFNPDKFDGLIILGAGLGYHLMPLKEIYHKYKKIVIIDCLKGIENEIEKNPDTGFITQKKNIKLLFGFSPQEIGDMLISEIDLSSVKGLSVIEHPASMRAFGKYYAGINEVIRRVINKKAGDLATIRAFGMLYLKNIFRNLGSAGSHIPISSFFKKMEGYPAIIVTSGPSIESQLDIIMKNQERFFIIAADSSLGLLLYHNIIPDFFLSIDPQPFIYEHLRGTGAADSIPIYSISSHPHAFSIKPGLVSLNTHPVAQIIDNAAAGKIGSVDSATGTVSGDAIMAGRMFGFRKIGLAGFDFSFPDLKIYPSGTSYQKRFANIITRFAPLENANMNYIIKSSGGIKYQNRFSRKSFIRYRESVEELISKNKIENLVNVNSLGISIKGIQDMPIDQFINSFCPDKINKREIIDDILSSAAYFRDILDYKKIKEIIARKDVFEELISESLEKDVSEFKINRLKRLFTDNL